MRYVFLVFVLLSTCDWRLGQAEVPLAVGGSSMESVLNEMMTSVLQKDNIFLVMDPTVFRTAEIDAIFKHSENPYFLMNWENIMTDKNLPREFIRGSYITVIIVFYDDPTMFLDTLLLSWLWNPDFVIMFSLDATMDTSDILGHKLIQRTKYIISIEPSQLSQYYLVYTIHHNIFAIDEMTNEIVSKELIGRWNESNFKSKEDLFRSKDLNFEGAVLDLASFCDDFPFMYHDKNGKCVGAGLDILDLLTTKLNFSYTVQDYPEDGMWGSFENGSWTGMLADLAYRNKSLIINNFLLTEERYTGFDVTYPYFSEGFNFVIKIPPPAPKWKGLTYPFTGVVWTSFICATFITGLLFGFAHFLLPDNNLNSLFILVSINYLLCMSYKISFSCVLYKYSVI